jgi:VIT1/CCC1 family predicted Fe2+/Mn2+ transporter
MPAPTPAERAAGQHPSRRRTPADIRRWRRYLAAERAEAASYRDLARRRTGEERAILLALAEAEKRHEAHWLDLLGDDVGQPARTEWRSRALGFLARRFGGVFVLALAQRAEARSTYSGDVDATAKMAADERIHEEVVRSLATRGRNRLSGTFRAAVFGANDGLVSNLALVLGFAASGVPQQTVLLSGLAGLLAGSLSMGAGEFVSVRSQRELLEASSPSPDADKALPHLDLDANELALVYRARGLSADAAQARADEALDPFALPAAARRGSGPATEPTAWSVPAGRGGGPETESTASAGEDGAGEAVEAVDAHETHGTAWGAASSSFCFFASGALIPVLPYLFGLNGMAAVAVASALVGIALLATGAIVGLLSGASPITRALRQLLIGFGAAAATYLLGLVFGTVTG